MGGTIDYAALAKQAGALSSQPAPPSGNVDYVALAKQAGSVGYQPPPAPSLTPEQARSRTLMNMTRAMSGQPMDNPEDQAIAVKAGEEGFKAAAMDAATLTTAGLVGAPSLVSKAGPLVPAGRDALGRFLPWVASQVTAEGPSLVEKSGAMLVNLVKAHPIASTYIATHLADALGIPLPKVVKAITLIPGGAE